MTNPHRAAASGQSCSAEMELDIGAQSCALLIAHGGGWCLGLLYDLLRTPRRRLGRGTAALLDILFCAASGAAAFLFAMSAGNGYLGCWELLAALCGFLLYQYTLSRVFMPVGDKIFGFFCRVARNGKIFTKKVCKTAKFYFQKSKECFIIKDEK